MKQQKLSFQGNQHVRPHGLTVFERRKENACSLKEFAVGLGFHFLEESDGFEEEFMYFRQV